MSDYSLSLLAGTVVVTDKAADEMAAPCHVSLAKQKRKRNFISAERLTWDKTI